MTTAVSLNSRICSKCKEIKFPSDFYKSKKDTFQPYCKTCCKESSKLSYLTVRNNKEKTSVAHRLYWSAYKSHLGRKHKGKETEFTITVETLESLLIKQDNKCYWTKVPLNLEINNEKYKYNAPSVDRLDNSKGYTPDNICITLWAVNRMRENLSVEDFTNLLNNIKTAK